MRKVTWLFTVVEVRPRGDVVCRGICLHDKLESIYQKCLVERRTFTFSGPVGLGDHLYMDYNYSTGNARVFRV